METIIAGIIGGVCTIAAAFVTYFLTTRPERASRQPISKTRKEALIGRWEGTLDQPEGPTGKPVTYSVVAQSKVKRKTVEVSLTLEYELDGEKYRGLEYEATGSYLHNRFLKLDYAFSDRSVIQFGAILLEHNDLGDALDGYLVGYGAVKRGLITGNVKLEKKE